MREISPYILENRVNFSPVLFGGFGQKPTFEKIFERVRTIFLKKSPEKVGKSPVLKTKSGQKNSEAFSENGTF
jgi:hypothetical protein